MTFDCMTPEELALWSENQVARARAKLPCSDCPLWFHLQEKAAGRCDRRPIQNGRPVGEQHRAVVHDKRHRQWREAGRRYRQRHGTGRVREWKAQLVADVEAMRRERGGVQ